VMSHDEYKEMIPVRALSALDAADDRVLSNHLTECAECRSQLDDWQRTTAGLALSVTPAEPSTQVRIRILAQLREEPPEPAAGKVIPFTSSQRSIWSSFGSLGAIAAAVLFLALLVSVVVLWRENRTMKTEMARLTAQNYETQKKLDFVKLIEKPGSKFTELTGMPIAAGAVAKLAYDQSGHAMVMTEGLPAAPTGKEYQLWYIVGNKPPMRGKTFAVDSQGKSVMEDQLPADAMRSAVFAVTLEPQGGSETPTMPIYLRSGS
jgi:anti-sigma-K factor RskA